MLSGNPTGRFSSATFTYTATDGNSDTVELTFTIVVTAPAFSFASNIANQVWTVGTAVSVTLPTATGGVGTLAYSLSSGLPSGVTFTGSTRALAGTPTGRFTSASFTYTVTDDEGETHTQTFTIVVTAVAITIPNIANQSWTVGTAVSLTLPEASGGVGAFTYSLTPTLPAGVSRTVRAVSGTPTTAVNVATYTYTAEDSEGITHTQTFTIVVAAAAVVLSFGSETISNQAWVAGTAVSVTLPVATGGTGDKTYTLSPTTPAGVTFTGMTRVLAGNPTATFTSATFTYTATDENNDTVELTFTIVVTADALVFASTIADQSWVVGTTVNVTLPTASGGVGDLTYSLTPTTPAGVMFTAGTRVLSGNPTAVFTLATFTYTVTDAESETLEQTFTIVVSAVIAVAPTTSMDATYDADLGYNVLPEALGALKKVESGVVESLGNLWYENQPYNVSAARMLSFDDDLHILTGYGNPDALLRYGADAAKPDNFQHLVFGETIHYVVPDAAFDGSIYSALAELALKTNATLSIHQGIIRVEDRSVITAVAEGATGTGAGNLSFESASRTFPTGGFLLIEKEIVEYTGVSSSAFTGITRGWLGSVIADHADATPITYLKYVFDQTSLIGEIEREAETDRVYNIIRDSADNVEVPDDDSIAIYGKIVYPLDLGLGVHENAWKRDILKSYLSYLKDLHYGVSFTLRPSHYLRLGDVICIQYNGLVIGGQIVSLAHNALEDTRVRIRTV